ncbi:MAG: hypothetical protein NWQ07_02560 [Flaviramulus sp.]|nr:hypothetical protein [Flaviramulus sp.]
MKKNLLFVLIIVLSTISCTDNSNNSFNQANISFNFKHNWDGTSITNSDFNTIKFINSNGENLSIERLRYLISKITFTTSAGEKLVFNDYNLVDLTYASNLSYNLITTIPIGTYNNVSFTFGFDNDANYNGNYADLNSVSWNVPAMLGGGYHFMQLEGKFTDNNTQETGYAYHVIRAVDNTGDSLIFEDTFFEVNFGSVTISDDTIFNIEMNIAEWFKNPNTWDLKVLNNMLMPNYDAQIMMFENGQNVFSLESIEQ